MSSYLGQTIRTQKARGLVSVMQNGGLFSQVARIPSMGEVEILPYRVPANPSWPMFARPCPTVPRHGFVESRSVQNLEELLDVWAETKAADPNGEVIIMPRLTGKASAVATDAGVTWGLGHDGATAGQGQLFVVPSGGKPGEFDSRIKMGIAAGVTDAAYVELVEHKGIMQIVQVRDGPPQPRGVVKNYVPTKNYEVTGTLEATQEQTRDMLKWEAAVKKAAPGTVILFPKGSLSAHVAVHGIAHGFAVLTNYSEPPAIGDKIDPPDNAPGQLNSKAYRYMARFIADAADKISLRRSMAFGSSQSADIMLATAVLHSLTQWDDAPHLLRLRAFGAVAMCKYLCAASIGEARHFMSGPGRFGAKPETPWADIMGRKLQDGKWSRSTVYHETLAMPLAKLEPGVIGAWKDFGGNWRETKEDFEADAYKDRHGVMVSTKSGGVGGPRWRASANIARKLCKAIRRFVVAPGPENWANVLKHYNMATSAAHNNGKLLDKFTSFSTIDMAAKAPSFAFVSARAMSVVTEISLADAFVKPKEATTPSKLWFGYRWYSTNVQGPIAAYDAAMKGNDCDCEACVEGSMSNIMDKVKACGQPIVNCGAVSEADQSVIEHAKDAGVLVIDNTGPVETSLEAAGTYAGQMLDSWGNKWVQDIDGAWIVSQHAPPTGLEVKEALSEAVKKKKAKVKPKPPGSTPEKITKPKKGKTSGKC